MQRIEITRDSNNNVQFETVSVDNTENVFFINLDTLEPHWPTIASNELGPSPSAPSSQCQPDPNLDPTDCPVQVTYQCKIAGHTNEQGTINIFLQIAPVANTTLAATVHGQPITRQQVVVGGLSPYQISGELFEVTVTGPGGAVIQSGPGIGPGLQLNPTTDNTGIWVTGTPTLTGTYTFTFTVDDGMGANLQQVQYTMVVS
jgi:hypothetical protein